ncbi:hypothetical protein AYM40_07060 [Paraburkholderia phytofirmans OLGA172]|uniref:Uncharacterized protein n=1 Tax=Paraburkholderia phytofirmans OLGA172 TaxID=1417228 RepID=A0A160FIT6_9BURK|nr:hypothetical protein [Paraburkholderia phytofirmans]ANB72152.1 hypothetical protein AYM40_07060 [Paraburkholderia phytofirmans OLGA172]
MRDVTNNLTATPETEQVKRGRGRPRKPDAMTGAQRQAAYRERRRAVSIDVTVTENEGPVDQMQILRELHERQVSVLRNQLARAEAELSDLRTTTTGSGGAPAFEVMLRLLAMACARKPLKAQLAIRESDVWRNGVAGASGVSDEQMKRVAAALAGNLT